jgi:hypothetical protein
VPYPVLNKRHKIGLFLVIVTAGLSLLLEASTRQTAGVILLGLAATWLVGSMALRTFGYVVSALVFTAGLYVAAFPVWLDWNVYHDRVHDYESAITDLRVAVAKSRPLQIIKSEPLPPLPKGFTLDSQPPVPRKLRPQMGQYTAADIDERTVEIPGTVFQWERAEDLSKQRQPVQLQQSGLSQPDTDPVDMSKAIPIVKSFPADMSDEEILHEFETKYLVRPSFSIWASVKSNRQTSFPGATFYGANRVTSLTGAALAVCGLLGLAWLSWSNRRPIQEIS